MHCRYICINIANLTKKRRRSFKMSTDSAFLAAKASFANLVRTFLFTFRN